MQRKANSSQKTKTKTFEDKSKSQKKHSSASISVDVSFQESHAIENYSNYVQYIILLSLSTCLFFLLHHLKMQKKKNAEAMNGMVVFAPWRVCICMCVISAMTHRAPLSTSLFHRTFKLQFYNLFIFIFIFAFVYRIEMKRNHAQNSHVDSWIVCCMRTHIAKEKNVLLLRIKCIVLEKIPTRKFQALLKNNAHIEISTENKR